MGWGLEAESWLLKGPNWERGNKMEPAVHAGEEKHEVLITV